MEIQQIKLEDWKNNEGKNPIPLLELPFSVLDIKKLLGLSFYEYSEPGLGNCYSCFIRIDIHEAHLKGFMAENSKKVGVIVEMHSNEDCPYELAKKICQLFDIELNELRWITNI